MPLQDITMSQTLPLMNGEYFYLILDIKFFPDQFQIENSWNFDNANFRRKIVSLRTKLRRNAKAIDIFIPANDALRR